MGPHFQHSNAELLFCWFVSLWRQDPLCPGRDFRNGPTGQMHEDNGKAHVERFGENPYVESCEEYFLRMK